MKEYSARVAEKGDVSRILEMTEGYAFRPIGNSTSSEASRTLDRGYVEPLVGNGSSW